MTSPMFNRADIVVRTRNVTKIILPRLRRAYQRLNDTSLVKSFDVNMMKKLFVECSEAVLRDSHQHLHPFVREIRTIVLPMTCASLFIVDYQRIEYREDHYYLMRRHAAQ